MAKILGFGECVFDFSSQSVASDGSVTYKACPGGSVANLCVATAKLGAQSTFVGKVGDDLFGHALKDVLAEHGVNTDGMMFTKECGTFLAFAERQPDGNVSYSWGNMPGADKFVRYDELPMALFQAADLAHFSSCAMATGETQVTEKRLMKELHDAGKIVSFDVNYRPLQYDSVDEARRVVRIPLGLVDIIKATDEELELVTGKTGQAGVDELLGSGASIVLLTRGSHGSSWYIRGASGDVAAPHVEEVDPVGAGDCYLGSFLTRIADEKDIRAISAQKVREAAEFASRASALSVTRNGAMAGMPTLREVEEAKL